MDSSRKRCEVGSCKEKGVVILPDDTLVCYHHYNERVISKTLGGRARAARHG